VEKLASLSEQISSLATGKVRIAHGSRYDGLTVGATRARTRTGATIVALMRDKDVIPSPNPEKVLRGGDTLVVVGTPDGIENLRQIIDD
jgi:TrkA domain protein